MKLRLITGTLLLGLLFTASCSKDYDDSEVTSQIQNNTNRIQALEQKVNSVNAELTSMRNIVLAYQQNTNIRNVEKVGGAWVITFTDNSTVALPDGKNGKDGSDGTFLGIDIDGGIYYWTITTNGKTEWLTDENGKKIRVDGKGGMNGLNGKDGQDGVTPLLRIDYYGYWEVSYDGGKTYVTLLDANGDAIYALPTDDTTVFFKDVYIHGSFVSFTMINGVEIKIPMETTLYLSFHETQNISINKGSTANIAFTVTGADASTFVECCAHGKLKARVSYMRGSSSGTVIVSVASKTTHSPGDDEVTVLLCNANTTIMYKLTFNVGEGYDYTYIIPEDPNEDLPGPNGGDDVTIPQPGTEVISDGDHNVLTLTLTGIQKSDGSWLDLIGTGNPRQNIWVAIDGKSKGFIVEDVSTGSTKAKADLVFLVDNSGTMDDEANTIANDIDNWAKQLAASNLDIQFGVVGYDGCIHGAVNLTSASSLSSYLNRSGKKGAYRTMGFAGSDAKSLESASYAYPRYCQEECGIAALRYADDLYNFRNGSNRVFVNFTDEPNQPHGNKEYSVNYLNSQTTWPVGSGTVHTVFSEDKNRWNSYLEEYYYENPWRMSEYTGGTTIFTNSSFTGVSLSSLPVTGALSHTVILRMLLPDSMLYGSHTITIVVCDQSGTYYQSRTFTGVYFSK